MREGCDEILTALVVVCRLDDCKFIGGQRLAGGIPNAGEVCVFVLEVRVLGIFEGGIERPLRLCQCASKCADCFGLISHIGVP